MTPEELLQNLRYTAEKHKKEGRLVLTGETNVCAMAHDCISTVENLLAKFTWVPVTERLPERPDYDWVLVKTVFIPEGGEGVPHVAELRGGVWYCDSCEGPMEETLSIKVVEWFDMQQLITKPYQYTTDNTRLVVENTLYGKLGAVVSPQSGPILKPHKRAANGCEAQFLDD